MIKWWKNRKIREVIRHCHNKRTQVLCNLKDVKRAVVMATYDQQESAARFANNLQQRGVDTTIWLLGTPEKAYEQYDNLPYTRMVRREELARYTALPLSPLKKEWQVLSHDALFDLTLMPLSLASYLIALSQAELKVGSNKAKYSIYDVVIAIQESENATILGDNMLFYLSKIDMKNNNL